jgi:hypothetical protein
MLMVEVLRSILWVGKEKQWDLTAWIHLTICADRRLRTWWNAMIAAPQDGWQDRAQRVIYTTWNLWKERCWRVFFDNRGMTERRACQWPRSVLWPLASSCLPTAFPFRFFSLRSLSSPLEPCTYVHSFALYETAEQPLLIVQKKKESNNEICHNLRFFYLSAANSKMN